MEFVIEPKILFISTQLPYPPSSGGTMKSWNYITYLSKKYNVSCAYFLKNDDSENQAEFKNSIRLEKIYAEPLQTKRSALNLLKSYFNAPCLNVFRNYSTSFKAKIEQLAASVDLLLIDHYEMFQYVPKSFKGKVVLHTHNAEFMLWQRMSELTNNPIKKMVLALEASRVKKYEKKIFKRADLIYSTPSDIELYKRHGFTTNKHRLTYHLGNDSLLDLAPLNFEETEKAITFMGTMSWEPNIDGIVWFIEKAWPIIKAQEADCKLYLLGKDPDQRILKASKKDPTIIFPGFVKDLDTYLKKTRVYIVPLRFGSGMKVKVLEGLYRGNPTVSTSVGSEGLAVENKKHLLIADESATFAKACLHLMNNQALWEELRDNSRFIAHKKYRWKPLFEQMHVALQKILPKETDK